MAGFRSWRSRQKPPIIPGSDTQTERPFAWREEKITKASCATAIRSMTRRQSSSPHDCFKSPTARHDELAPTPSILAPVSRSIAPPGARDSSPHAASRSAASRILVFVPAVRIAEVWLALTEDPRPQLSSLLSQSASNTLSQTRSFQVRFEDQRISTSCA
jgi:hypothetical protein